MDGGDKAVDVHQTLQSNFDETHVASGDEQERPQIQHEWIGNDLGEGVEMGVVASHGHGKIHLIDTSRNVPFEQGSESMVNSGKEENRTRQDIDGKLLQQPKAGVRDAMENIRNMDSLRVIQFESGNGLRTVESEQRDASETIMAQSLDDLKVIAPGAGLDSRATKQEEGNASMSVQPGSGLILQESRDDLRATKPENMDDLRVFQSEEQNLSPGQTEENCPSDMALSQDTGDGAEAFYRMNPESTNGTAFFLSPQSVEDADGTEEEQAAFVRELENFFKENNMEFKPPKFYGENLNCLKLWRAVTRLGGYEQVTSSKLWRQVGESFKPPKTCTTVSWSFRGFYEKALVDYERHKLHGGSGGGVGVSGGNGGGGGGSGGGGVAMPNVQTDGLLPAGGESQPCATQVSGSGRARRDAAARAMQGWHSQRLLGNGEVGDPIVKDKNSVSVTKREKQLKSIGMLKRKKTSTIERAVKAARTKGVNPQMDAMVVDVGPQADWVKVNVHRTRDCFEVYALVPGLLREEVRVQCDPAGRLVISGDPEQPDNPWGVTPFKKVISLPSRIDSNQTSAVVTLHGQLFVRVPFEQSEL